MVSNVSYAALAAAAVLAGAAQAHQSVYIPAPTFTTTDKTTKTNPIAFLENQGFKPTEDVNGFLKDKGVKTLREFLDNKANYKSDAAGATFECGYTDPNGARQPIPANGMMRSSGFTHEGPCEVWIDNTRVLGSSSGNCNKDVPGQPVSYKIDFSVCKGDCLIRWYWLAKRLIGKKWSWQVYKECIPIRGGAARSIEDSEDPDSHSYRVYTNETESEDATDAYRGYEGVDGEEILPTKGLADEGVDGEEILPTKGLDEDVRGYEGVDGEEILPTKGLEDDADTQSVGMIENDNEDTESTRYYEDDELKSIPIDEYEAKEETPAYD